MGLPWGENKSQLLNSCPVAADRVRSLKRRLLRDEMFEPYDRVIGEIKFLRFIEQVLPASLP